MIILDASVIIKWFLQEEGSSVALKFKDAITARQSHNQIIKSCPSQKQNKEIFDRINRIKNKINNDFINRRGAESSS